MLSLGTIVLITGVLGLSIWLAVGLKRELKRRSIVKMRHAHSERSGNVRQGDLSKSQDDNLASIKREVEKHLKKGEVLKAALTYKQAGLNREAISTLEQAGEIERACQILMELGSPARAGAVFERHALYEEAGSAYLKAGLQGDAARCLELGAEKSPELYASVAQIYKALGKTSRVLKVYAKAGLIEEFLRYAYREAAWPALRDFMSTEESTRKIVALMDFGMLRAFIRELPLDKHTVQCLARWTQTVKKLELVEISVKKLCKRKELISKYWTLLPEKQVVTIAEKISTAASKEGKEGLNFILLNAGFLYEVGSFAAALLLYKSANRHLMAAKCHAHLGQLEQALHALKKTGDRTLIAEFDGILEQAPKQSESFEFSEPSSNFSKWDSEVLAKALDVLQSATPERDETERASPFVLAG